MYEYDSAITRRDSVLFFSCTGSARPSKHVAPPRPCFSCAVRVYVDVVNNARLQGARMTLISPVMGVIEEAPAPVSQEGEKPPGKRRRKAGK